MFGFLYTIMTPCSEFLYLCFSLFCLCVLVLAHVDGLFLTVVRVVEDAMKNI